MEKSVQANEKPINSQTINTHSLTAVAQYEHFPFSK